MTNVVLSNIKNIFKETELKPEILILSKINPIDYKPIITSVNKTGRLYVVEEGNSVGGVGSKIIAKI